MTPPTFTPSPTALFAAAGTGGHIFPGLAIARVLRERGVNIHWLGTPTGMENTLVGAQGYPMSTIHFSGLRGKRLSALLLLPFRLIAAMSSTMRVLGAIRPQVVVGMGGYIVVPLILANAILKIFGRGAPAVLHEQNSLAGTANRWMSPLAQSTLCGFEGALRGARVVGNPVAETFFKQPPPQERYAQRMREHAPLSVLILGGSLGAQALNALIPQALTHFSIHNPTRAVRIIHQCGRALITSTEEHYRAQNLPHSVNWAITPFIDDVAEAMAQADVVIARAGAQTVSEISAVGVACVFVPFPFAIDDHQTHNAQYLVAAKGAELMPQSTLKAEDLAQWLATQTREGLCAMAMRAHLKAKPAADVQCAEIIMSLIPRNQ